jgi:GntR family transcriptional regulator / MocR family aminotransferase
MGTSSPELFLALDRSRRRGLRAQIEDELRAAIRSGRLAAGSPVPSTRALAADLNVTRKVVVEAYDQLVAEGYLLARQGARTIAIGALPRPAATGRGPAAARGVAVDFRPGRPDLDLFPRTAWLRASRAAVRAMTAEELTDDDPRGLPGLRAALAEYLGRVRGVSADPDRIIVCAGFGHGFDLTLDALTGLGHDRFAVEDPGYPAPRRRLLAAAVPFDPIPVDGAGLDVERLRAGTARAVVVTPAHQSPTGVVLPPGRRQRLVEWARAVDGYVIEDDFDAEYRYDRRPVGALQGIDPERVIYCGTASKTLASGLRLGWLVVPAALVEPIVTRRRLTDGATSTLLQASFAEFLRAHDLDRHLRRVRPVYRRRRDALVAALYRELPEATVHGVAAGLNVLITLPAGVTEEAVVTAALAAGVRVHPLGGFRAGTGSDDVPGLVLGYGSVAPGAAELGVRRLAAAIRG